MTRVLLILCAAMGCRTGLTPQSPPGPAGTGSDSSGPGTSGEETGATGSSGATGATGATGLTIATADTGHTGDTGTVEVRWLDATVTVRCNPSSGQFEAIATGEASSALLDMADTYNNQTIYGNWNETHPMPIASYVPGTETTFALDVALTATRHDWTPGSTSLFRCTPHLDDPDIMSYIVRVYDAAGDLADCVAFGHDPQGFIDDASPYGDPYVIYNPRPQEADFAGCRVR